MRRRNIAQVLSLGPAPIILDFARESRSIKATTNDPFERVLLFARVGPSPKMAKAALLFLNGASVNALGHKARAEVHVNFILK